MNLISWLMFGVMKRLLKDNRRNISISIFCTALFLSFTNSLSFAQKKNANQLFSPTLYQALKWRNVGPYRGGRSTASCGVPSEPYTFYLGTAGGGIWKTEDAGKTWENISDGYLKSSSIGAIAVAPSDPNVIYAGTGETPARTVNPTHGDGVYKSTDAGKTWTQVGLDNTSQIGRIRINSKNPDIVYVAAEGTPWAKTADRGIYRSMDGGKTWKLILHVDDESGANDLSMDMTNPRILYAAFWDHQRKPWKMVSGGSGSGIWKTTDGGDHWTKLTDGLPKEMGKIGVAVSPANPERVWAIVEAKKGGLYRSDDAGKRWKLINSHRVIWARSWYYMDVFADPQNQDIVYVANAPLLKSIDGGKNFKTVKTPHGDNHFLWINPRNPDYMINSNDGGGNISLNGGKSWSTQQNQPTGEFYRVNTDNRFPYYIYGGQQDEGTVAIANWSPSAGIQRQDWYSVGGGESAFVAFDPDNPAFVYAGSYQGIITEYNTKTKEVKNISEYPSLRLAANPAQEKYRFTWNAPIITSKFNPKVIYHAGNVLLKSTDRGLTWKPISPDLTRNNPKKLENGGEPFTNEGAGGEVYQTISYVAEAPNDPGTLWSGNDDGLMHITRDGGKTWSDITPKDVGEKLINSIDVSKQDPAEAYIAVEGYRTNDYSAHIYRTEDYGKHWKNITDGIPSDDMVHVVREDHVKRGLLFAGTQRGMYISFDDGDHWQKFQLNLPLVPVTDLQIHNNALVASTQGRAFWVLDDISPLRQLNQKIANIDAYLFHPGDNYRTNFGRVDTLNPVGTNPESGITIYYYLKKVTAADSTRHVDIKVLSQDGKLIRNFSSTAGKKQNKVEKKTGLNRLVWNLRYADYKSPKGLFHAMGKHGYKVGPGIYQIQFTYGKTKTTDTVTVKPDPRYSISNQQYREQQDILSTIRSDIQDVYSSVNKMNEVKGQINDMLKRVKEEDDTTKVVQTGKALIEEIKHIKKKLVQTRQKTFQDVINFPNMLDNQLLVLQNTISGAEPPVTNGAKERYRDLQNEWSKYKTEIDQLFNQKIPAFNHLLAQKKVKYIAPGE